MCERITYFSRNINQVTIILFIQIPQVTVTSLTQICYWNVKPHGEDPSQKFHNELEKYQILLHFVT